MPKSINFLHDRVFDKVKLHLTYPTPGLNTICPTRSIHFFLMCVKRTYEYGHNDLQCPFINYKLFICDILDFQILLLIPQYLALMPWQNSPTQKNLGFALFHSFHEAFFKTIIYTWKTFFISQHCNPSQLHDHNILCTFKISKLFTLKILFGKNITFNMASSL